MLIYDFSLSKLSFTMVPALLLGLIFVVHQSSSQSLQWYGLEPHAEQPMVSMFTAIYKDTLFLIGGLEESVTTMDVSNIYMNDYSELLYQPDLNVENAKWQTESYWYTLNYGLFCNQSCTTQIDNLLYIVAPFRNSSNIISKTSTLFIYDLSKRKFEPINTYQSNLNGFDAEYACIVNNQSHIFLIGGGDWSNTIRTV